MHFKLRDYQFIENISFLLTRFPPGVHYYSQYASIELLKYVIPFKITSHNIDHGRSYNIYYRETKRFCYTEYNKRNII